MSAELDIRPDPTQWSLVPEPAAAEAWAQARLAARPAQQHERLVDALVLALRTRVESDATFVLLLDTADSTVLATLTILASGDIPAASGADEAIRIAAALAPSPWEAGTIDLRLGEHSGWRVTTFDGPAEGAESVGDGAQAATVISTVTTTYVLEVGGCAVIALLSPLQAEAAFVAQHHAEQALSTLEVTG